MSQNCVMLFFKLNDVVGYEDELAAVYDDVLLQLRLRPSLVLVAGSPVLRNLAERVIYLWEERDVIASRGGKLQLFDQVSHMHLTSLPGDLQPSTPPELPEGSLASAGIVLTEKLTRPILTIASPPFDTKLLDPGLYPKCGQIMSWIWQGRHPPLMSMFLPWNHQVVPLPRPASLGTPLDRCVPHDRVNPDKHIIQLGRLTTRLQYVP